MVVLVLIAFVYVGLYLVLWLPLSQFLPPVAAELVPVAILGVGSWIVGWRWLQASIRVGAAMTARSFAKANPELPRPRTSAVRAVRLAGVGGRKDRFDTSLVERQPLSPIGGVPAGELRRIKDRDLYLLAARSEVQLWTRSGLGFRHVLSFDLTELTKFGFIEHDPDGLVLRDAHERKYVGTYDLTFGDAWHVFLFARIHPRYGEYAPIIEP